MTCLLSRVTVILTYNNNLQFTSASHKSFVNLSDCKGTFKSQNPEIFIVDYTLYFINFN